MWPDQMRGVGVGLPLRFLTVDYHTVGIIGMVLSFFNAVN